MRINKSVSRYLAFGIVIVVILLTALMGSNQTDRVPLPSIELLKNKDGSFEASVVFGEFRKSEVKNGKKQWEVYSKVGRYRPKDGMAELEDPIVSLYRENDVITLTAQRGIVKLEGTVLKQVEAIGDVVIDSESNKTTIRCQQMEYEQATETIKAKGKVEIESSDMLTTGIDLQGNTELNNYKLMDDVQTKIQPKKHD